MEKIIQTAGKMQLGDFAPDFAHYHDDILFGENWNKWHPALFQRYVPADAYAELFGTGNEGFGVLMAATIGVPLYACGGGTIPLLQQWLMDGMSMGSATAFMITGPATKITNLGAVKIVLGMKHFIFYIAFVILFSLIAGMMVNLVI